MVRRFFCAYKVVCYSATDVAKTYFHIVARHNARKGLNRITTPSCYVVQELLDDGDIQPVAVEFYLPHPDESSDQNLLPEIVVRLLLGDEKDRTNSEAVNEAKLRLRNWCESLGAQLSKDHMITEREIQSR